MKRIPHIMVATLLGFAINATAADWQPLCNGSDLTGWTEDKPELNHWQVIDGVIVGANGAEKQGSILWTEESFGDFIFETDYRYTGIVDSGIFVKQHRYQVNLGISNSLKVDMTCSIYAPEDGEGKYPGKAEGVAELQKVDDWNTVRIEARGKHILVSLNGTQVLDYQTKALAETGPLGLQLHAGFDMQMEFRNPRIRLTNGSTAKSPAG